MSGILKNPGKKIGSNGLYSTGCELLERQEAWYFICTNSHDTMRLVFEHEWLLGGESTLEEVVGHYRKISGEF